MTYEKLRYLEQLLSSVYSNGVEKYREEIEEYFKENYGEDSLVKPKSVQEPKNIKKQTERKTIDIPDNLDDKLSQAIERVFRRSKWCLYQVSS